MNEITRVLAAIGGGAASAADLLPLVYEELRRIAAHRMAGENPGHTLQPTALVHEAWLRLGEQSFENRAHFFSAAAEAMRRILIESARRKARLKHGGEWQRVGEEVAEIALPMPAEELLALDDALARLAQRDPTAAQLVRLCFFAGLTKPQAAHELGLSLRTAERTWKYTRAWLFCEIKKTTVENGAA